MILPWNSWNWNLFGKWRIREILKSIIPDIVGWNLRYFQNLQCNRQLRCIQSDMGLVDRSMLEAYYIGKKKIIIIRDNTRFHFFSCNQYSFSIEIGSYQFHVKKNKSYYYFFLTYWYAIEFLVIVREKFLVQYL